MFVQVIQGPVGDPAGLKAQFDKWDAELRPGAAGFLGATGGIAADQRFHLLARFETADLARANSERPEQGVWWSETESCFSGLVEFRDSDDVTTFMGGGSDSAGFVQIIESPSTDRARLESMDELFAEFAAGWRPEVIGGIRAWSPEGAYTEAVYFTSEQEARANESSEPPPSLAPQMEEFRALIRQASFVDLTDPWLS